MKFINKTVTIFILTAIIISFSACSNISENQEKQPELKDIYKVVTDDYGENYIPEVPIEKESLLSMTEVNENHIEDFIAEMPMSNLNSDIFIAIKAAKGKGQDVENALANYQKYIAEESFQYPVNLAKAKASTVVRHGDFVFFLMLGAVNGNADATEEEVLSFAQEQIKIGTDAIAGIFK